MATVWNGALFPRLQIVPVPHPPDNPLNAVMIGALADIHKRRRSSLANGLALAADRQELRRLRLNAWLLLHGNIRSASFCSTSRWGDCTESSRSLHAHWEQTPDCRQRLSTWILSNVSKVFIVRLALMLTHFGGSTFVALPSSPWTESIDIKAVKNRCPDFFHINSASFVPFQSQMRQCWCTLITAALSKTGKHRARPRLIILNVCVWYMFLWASYMRSSFASPWTSADKGSGTWLEPFASTTLWMSNYVSRRRGGWPPLCECVWAVVFMSTIALASLPTLAKVDASLGFLMLCCFHSDQGCSLAFCGALLGQQTAPNVCTHPHYISVCVCVNVWVHASLSARLRSYVTKTAEQTMPGTVSPFTCLSVSNLQQSRTESVHSLQFIFRSCHLFVESSGFVWGGWKAGPFHMHSKLHTWIRIIILTCIRCVCGGGFTPRLRVYVLTVSGIQISVFRF